MVFAVQQPQSTYSPLPALPALLNMIFFKAVVVSTFAILAAVMVTATPVDQCNTGPAQCCNTVGAAGDSGIAGILGLLGVITHDVSTVVGFGCKPISVIAVGGGIHCDQQPVCCTDNSFNGLVNVGCSPISL
ncbi:hydrophobin [Gautieria morchelliformis]|nr:hydrophobin [Gautieria morchelliformis]